MPVSEHTAYSGSPQPFAVILGANEIASAIAVQLVRAGYLTVISHDHATPVLRRKMAFHDALYGDDVTLVGISAVRIDTGMQVLLWTGRPDRVLITRLGLLDLIVARRIDVLVDARMQKYQITPDLRALADATIGVGPGFIAGENCLVAIETLPEQEGRVVRSGATCPPDGVPRRLGDRGADRFVLAPVAGRWHTPLEIGTRVYKGLLIGTLGEVSLFAPFDGTLRGAVRDGVEVAANTKLFELDPRARGAVWRGIDERARAIGAGVMEALAICRQPPRAAARPSLVK